MIPDKVGRRARSTSVHRTRRESPKTAVWDKFPVKCPVVGIGIPSGDLDPLAKLLRTVPQHSGLAFVVVPSRPSGGQDSMETLRRLTPMRVIEAADGLDLSPDTLYIAPRDAFVKVSEGILRFRRRQPDDASPVFDPFLCSLAEERGRGAIGILLTDVTSDGILGLRDIKCAAGITLARASSVFSDGTPGGAWAAGYVDYLLAPDEIARELVRLAAHPYLLRPQAETPISDAELEEIHRTLVRVTSADLRSFRPELVRRRILRRMALCHIATASEYVRYLRGDSQEPLNLFAELLLNKEGFFPQAAAFEDFRTSLYDALRKQRQPGDGLRVWVPFCSTGEQTYSTSMALLETMGSGSRGGIQIFGTDLDEHALEIARCGIYPASVVGDLAAAQLSRFFTREGYSYRIRREARELCVFARHHLASDAPLPRMDLIVFRNRLQSLIPAMQERVLRLLHYSLRPSGVLALGESDSVEAAAYLFSAMPGKRGIYVRKENGARTWAIASGTLSGPGPRAASRNLPVQGESTPPERVLEHAAQAAAEPLRGAPVDLSAIRAGQHIHALVEEQAHTIEALRVANEEINCSNEELMVTNEELTAAREELQAANQELGTLNQELEDRNRALARTSLELSALLRNVNIPVVTVDSKLRIRHFTPQAQKLFNFTPQDVGRPITDLKPKLDIPDLELLLNETLANLTSHGKVFRSPESERYWVSIRPYRSEDDRIDGAILCAWPLV